MEFRCDFANSDVITKHCDVGRIHGTLLLKMLILSGASTARVTRFCYTVPDEKLVTSPPSSQGTSTPGKFNVALLDAASEIRPLSASTRDGCKTILKLKKKSLNISAQRCHMQALTILYIGGASSCADLFVCQDIDGSGETWRKS